MDEFYAVAMGQDNSAFFGGHLDYEFFMVKVNGDGNVVWERTVRHLYLVSQLPP